MTKKKQTPVPEGYKLLERNTRLKSGDLYLDTVDDPGGAWEPTSAAGSTQWHPDFIYCRKISKASKPKPPKLHTWEPVDFRAMLPKRPTLALYESTLEQATEIANQLGTENAKLKNQIAELRRKQKGNA